MNDSDLADKARGVARCLSYSDGPHPAAAKQLLREMAHRLDANNLSVHRRKRGAATLNIDDQRPGLYLSNALGWSRRLTIKERILFRLFGTIPPRHP